MDVLIRIEKEMFKEVNVPENNLQLVRFYDWEMDSVKEIEECGMNRENVTFSKLTFRSKWGFPTKALNCWVMEVEFETNIGDFNFDLFTRPLWEISFVYPEDAPKVDAYI